MLRICLSEHHQFNVVGISAEFLKLKLLIKKLSMVHGYLKISPLQKAIFTLCAKVAGKLSVTGIKYVLTSSTVTAGME